MITGDLTNRRCHLKADCLRPDQKHKAAYVFRAICGFGCKPDSTGKVYGYFEDEGDPDNTFHVRRWDIAEVLE